MQQKRRPLDCPEVAIRAENAARAPQAERQAPTRVCTPRSRRRVIAVVDRGRRVIDSLRTWNTAMHGMLVNCASG
jgi:hypothetical protein